MASFTSEMVKVIATFPGGAGNKMQFLGIAYRTPRVCRGDAEGTRASRFRKADEVEWVSLPTGLSTLLPCRRRLGESESPREGGLVVWPAGGGDALLSGRIALFRRELGDLPAPCKSAVHR